VRLATIPDGTRDGTVVRLSDDGTRMARCAGSLREAMEDWDAFAATAAALEPDEPFDPARAMAPLPRTWQWLDASAFHTHGELLQLAYGLPPVPIDPPLMYQGMSHRFLAGHETARFPTEDHHIDFEAELGVIVDDVPMGTTAAEAMAHIKLVVLINDWSLRKLGAEEMRTGFGWVRAKPACSMAPIAVTPDELGDAWRDGRVHLPVDVTWNGTRFGAANAREMGYGFHELIAHAAQTRDLCAGTVIGSGTISNADYMTVGSSCIAERRAIEKAREGAIRTDFMAFGDRVRIEVGSLFGAIDQSVGSI
jgi:fumarylacetoacetate (FAA) hydrolase